MLLFPTTASATIYTIVDNGFAFNPATITILVGDTVVFSLGPMHNAVEVTQTTWNNNGNTPNGGFSTPFGGGTVVFPNTGTYYYVCSPHAAMGMKGIINVVLTTISTGSITPTSYCKGSGVTVPFTITGSFSPGNEFTAQLSDANGSFSTPVSIGTLSGTSAGQISATIPVGTANGTGYRIRVISSMPVVTGSDNGTDLQVLDQATATITPAGPTTFCQGSDVTLDANTGMGLTYLWRLDGVVIGGATASSYVATLPGMYTVEVSNGTCSALSIGVRVTVNPSNPTLLVWTGTNSTDWNEFGNWDSPCAVPTAGDTVVIGPSATSMPTNIPAISLSQLQLNNGNGIVLENDLDITDGLVLTAGTITLGDNTLSLGPNATITGGGASSFIITNGDGELRQAGIGPGGRTGAILFPVGSAAMSYTPLTMVNSGTQDEFRVAVRDNVLEDGDSGTPLTANVVGKTWLISEATPGGSNAILTFQWNSVDEFASFDRMACYIARHDGVDWTPVQSIGAATSTAPYMRTVTGVSMFSPFAIGDGASPLPVEYRTLTLDVIERDVHLRWETEREVNSLGFEIERSVATTGQWTTLAFIESIGTSRDGASYSYIDVPPGPGLWLYRLRQIDIDGTVEYSSELNAMLSAPQQLAIESVYPNPVQHTVSSEVTLLLSSPWSGHATLKLYDILGREVAQPFSGQLHSGAGIVVRHDASNIPPGLYMYSLQQESNVLHRRLVIQR